MSDHRDRNDAIGTEASHWFAAMRGPDADAERKAFLEWRDRDPRHAQAYSEVEAIFSIAQGATRPERRSEPAVTAMSMSAPPARRKGIALRPVGIAAGLAAIIALGTITFTKSSPQGGEPGPAVVASSKSPSRVERYGDGTLVLLGAATLVTANLGDAVRQFTISEGRARFIVQPGTNTTAIVIAKGRSIRAQSAIFDVEIAGPATRVTVVSGSIAIDGGEQAAATTLAGGETVTLQDGQQPERSATRASQDQDWPPERPSFDGAMLDDVVRLANSFGGKPLYLASSDIGRMRVTGSFDVRDTGALARKLAAALNLRVTDSDRQISLSRE